VFEQLRKENQVAIKLSEPRKQVEAKGPARGPDNARVTMVEFSDFQCPFCSRAHDTVEQVMQAYAGKVRLVFRHFPLDIHKNAAKAAEAALCANEQGKFWEYHDMLFKNQQTLEVTQLKDHANAVGLDQAKFASCLDSSKFSKAVQEDMAAGQQVGVSGTPAFFINGVMLSGAMPFDEFKRVIDQELGTN
jgi:protein-disulfide isomerase